MTARSTVIRVSQIAACPDHRMDAAHWLPDGECGPHQGDTAVCRHCQETIEYRYREGAYDWFHAGRRRRCKPAPNAEPAE